MADVKVKAKSKAKKKAVRDFEAIFTDPALGAGGRIEQALAFDPKGLPGAAEVRRRQENIKKYRIVFHGRHDGTFDRRETRQVGDCRHYATGIVRHNVLKIGRITSPREFRDVWLEHRHCDRNDKRATKSGDRRLTTAFAAWYDKNIRPIKHPYIQITYMPTPKRRGLQCGCLNFEGLVDLQALRRSGWTAEAEPTFDLAGIVSYDPLAEHLWYATMVAMMTLQEETVDRYVPNRPQEGEDLEHDLKHALTNPTPRLLSSLPAGTRFCCRQSEEDPLGLSKTSLRGLAARTLEVPRSRVREVVIHTSFFDDPASGARRHQEIAAVITLDDDGK